MKGSRGRSRLPAATAGGTRPSPQRNPQPCEGVANDLGGTRRDDETSGVAHARRALPTPGDRRRLADAARGRLQHGHLAHWRLGEELLGLVVLAHLEGRHVDLDAVVLRDDQALQSVHVAGIGVELHGWRRVGALDSRSTWAEQFRLDIRPSTSKRNTMRRETALVGKRMVARVGALLLFCATAARGATRYHLCNFTCPDSNSTWTACRAERCSPRLPEDMCLDGSEPTLSTEGSKREGQGRPLHGPLECEAWGVPSPGSFAERCEICTGLATEVTDLMRRATEPLSAEDVCVLAGGLTRDALPQIRSCKLEPSLCLELLEHLTNASDASSMCHTTWEMLQSGKRAGEVGEAAQRACGRLYAQRVGSNVTDAEFCPAPRDIGARVMALSAVVALGILGLQLTQA